jgi:hypothetical protein
MRNATVTSRRDDAAALETPDRRSEIWVRVYVDQTPGGIDYVEIRLRETDTKSIELPPALDSVASYASTALHGAPFTLTGWSTGVGRFAGPGSSPVLRMEFAETLEPVMTAIAERIRAVPSDGAPQVHDELIDPQQSRYRWTFNRRGDVTYVAIEEDLSNA